MVSPLWMEISENFTFILLLVLFFVFAGAGGSSWIVNVRDFKYSTAAAAASDST